MHSAGDTPKGGLPHSDTLRSLPGYRLPQDFRRFPRPSSPPDAETSTICPLSLDHINPTPTETTRQTMPTSRCERPRADASQHEPTGVTPPDRISKRPRHSNLGATYGNSITGCQRTTDDTGICPSRRTAPRVSRERPAALASSRIEEDTNPLRTVKRSKTRNASFSPTGKTCWHL